MADTRRNIEAALLPKEMTTECLIKREKRPYKDIAKKIIKMCMGDKILLPEDKNQGKNEEENKIEMKFELPKERVASNVSIQQKIFNVLSFAVGIGWLLYIILVPVINNIVFSVNFAKRLYLDYIYKIEVVEGKISFLKYYNDMLPAIKYYGINVLIAGYFSLMVFSIIIALYILKIAADIIEGAILKRSIERNYDKISRKTQELDEEEALKRKWTKK
jgi:hypothetical protein